MVAVFAGAAGFLPSAGTAGVVIVSRLSTCALPARSVTPPAAVTAAIGVVWRSTAFAGLPEENMFITLTAITASPLTEETPMAMRRRFTASPWLGALGGRFSAAQRARPGRVTWP